MKIAVLGAGAIGCLVAGYLRLKDEDISLIGRPDSVMTIRQEGLKISGVRGNFRITINACNELSLQPELLILTTKTQDIDAALNKNLIFLKDSLILTTQNGIQADCLVAKYILKENIISSIIMFGATFLESGSVVHNFEGSWILGSVFDKNYEKVATVSNILNKIFPTIVTQDLKGMKYLKIFVNANNCIPAILGKSMQEVFSDIDISRISICIWKEGLDIINKTGINLVSLPDFPRERLLQLTAMPRLEAAKIFSNIMVNLSKEPLYGSILQSIKRGRTSEIDYINGEFIKLANENNLSAPLNAKLVQMVHEVETNKKFFTKEELLKNIEGLVS